MSNFVYDVVTLNGNKQDRTQIPAGENPNAWIQSSDWNPVVQSEYDIRGAIINNRFLGFQQLADEPNVPTDGAADFMWLDNTGKLWAKINGTSHNLLSSGGGISGLTAGKVPQATSATTIADAPWSRGWTEDSPGQPSTGILNIDGGSTNGNGAINIQPSSGFGNYGAWLSLDTQSSDSSNGTLWNIGNWNVNTSYPKWCVISNFTSFVFGISPGKNFYFDDSSGDFLDGSKVTIGGNLKFTKGGKIMYTVADATDWTSTAPVFMQDAVDRIAAWIKTNGGGPLP